MAFERPSTRHLKTRGASLRFRASPPQSGPAMELTNLETVPGKTVVKHLGLVQGSTVRSKHAGRDILAGLKNIVGGELKAYTELLNESRQEAIDRMVGQ